MRSTERRWVLTAPEWTLRPQPPSFPSCSHFLLASQFVGRLSPVKPRLNSKFRRKWLVLNVCVIFWTGLMLVTLDLVVTKLASEEGENRDALGTTDESLEPLHQLRGSLQCLLPQHETQPAGIVHYSHLHSWREVPAIAAGCDFVNQILYFPLFLQSSFKEWVKCWTFLLYLGYTELPAPSLLKHQQGYWNS